MTILATGKNGTIGRFLPDEVIAIDYRKESFESEKIPEGIMNSFNLIHLAGVVGEKRVLQNVTESKYVNVDKTIQLAKHFSSQKLSKFFYISTSHVYSNSKHPISEQSPLDPVSEYAKQKLEAENELKKIFIDSPNKLCILRVFSVLTFGSKDFTLGAAIKEAATNSEYKILNVDDERDFLHPLQIIEIMLKLTKLQTLPQVINICSGRSISVREAVQRIAKHNQVRIAPDQLISGNSEKPRILGDATLLNSLVPHDHTRYKCFD